MEEKKEILNLKMMIHNWKNSYIRLAEEDNSYGEDNLYLLEDFIEDIYTYLPLYTSRLVKIEYITEEELRKFQIFIISEIEDLKKVLGIS